MLDVHVSYLVPQEKKKKMLLKVLGYLCAGEPIDRCKNCVTYICGCVNNVGRLEKNISYCPYENNSRYIIDKEKVNIMIYTFLLNGNHLLGKIILP